MFDVLSLVRILELWQHRGGRRGGEEKEEEEEQEEQEEESKRVGNQQGILFYRTC